MRPLYASCLQCVNLDFAVSLDVTGLTGTLWLGVSAGQYMASDAMLPVRFTAGSHSFMAGFGWLFGALDEPSVADAAAEWNPRNDRRRVSVSGRVVDSKSMAFHRQLLSADGEFGTCVVV